ncbi:MAG TPA: glucose 1-dehydrogenase [Bryobacteraceae bacterium]|nr:glucose 1-dehydrogenase [Bryobacteraceae bacterium]
MEQLKGKVALVTGGSSGIGRATAIAFARAGAHVVLAARGVERGNQVLREIQESGGSATFIRADVSQGEQVRALIAETVAEYGRLDCAFNNAASLEAPFAVTADFTEDEFDRSMSLNLKSIWLCMKEEIRQMLSQDPPGGAIVNTSSVNGLGGVPQASLYAAAKAGVLAFTKSAALEYARQGIRVNALVAGGFQTPMLENVFDRVSGGDAAARQAIINQYEGLVALGRIGRPEEAAEAVLWLCSDAASYVTGHSMIVDGGWTAATR